MKPQNAEYFSQRLRTPRVVSGPRSPKKTRSESIGDADKTDLPRVLLVGDSITRGIFVAVEKHLAGKAYCARLTRSKCVSDPTFNDDPRLMLKQYKFSVIHFNNGLHGWGYTEDQYRDGLLKTVVAIKEHAGNSTFIWATTTPVREPPR